MANHNNTAHNGIKHYTYFDSSGNEVQGSYEIVPMLPSQVKCPSAVTDFYPEERIINFPYAIMGRVTATDIPKQVSFDGVHSQFNRLVYFDEVSLQDRVLYSPEELGNIILDNYAQVKLSSEDKLDKYNVEEGKTINAVPYKMTELTASFEKDVIGNIYEKYNEAIGTLSLLHPELKCISNPAYIFNRSNYHLGVHVENFIFCSINLLCQGEKHWDFFPGDNYPGLNTYLKEVEETKLNDFDESCEWGSFHKNIYVGLSGRKKFNAVRIRQLPGDVFIVPSGIPHQVVSIKDSMSISFNFVDTKYADLTYDQINQSCQCFNVNKKQKSVLSKTDIIKIQKVCRSFKNYAEAKLCMDISKGQHISEKNIQISNEPLAIKRKVSEENECDTHKEKAKENIISCKKCRLSFTSDNTYNVHRKKCVPFDKPLYSCNECEKIFTSHKGLNDHIKRGHEILEYPCECGKSYDNKKKLSNHVRYCGSKNNINQ